MGSKAAHFCLWPLILECLPGAKSESLLCPHSRRDSDFVSWDLREKSSPRNLELTAGQGGWGVYPPFPCLSLLEGFFLRHSLSITLALPACDESAPETRNKATKSCGSFVDMFKNEKQQQSWWGQSRVSEGRVGIHLERQVSMGPRRAVSPW